MAFGSRRGKYSPVRRQSHTSEQSKLRRNRVFGARPKRGRNFRSARPLERQVREFRWLSGRGIGWKVVNSCQAPFQDRIGIYKLLMGRYGSWMWLTADPANSGNRVQSAAITASGATLQGLGPPSTTARPEIARSGPTPALLQRPSTPGGLVRSCDAALAPRSTPTTT